MSERVSHTEWSENEFFQASVVNDDILLVTLNGNLDGVTTEDFNNKIQSHLDNDKSHFIIDCRRLGSISSLGVGALVRLQTRVQRNGGAVKLAAITGMAAQVIRVVKLNKVLDIYDDAESARNSFNS